MKSLFIWFIAVCVAYTVGMLYLSSRVSVYREEALLEALQMDPDRSLYEEELGPEGSSLQRAALYTRDAGILSLVFMIASLAVFTVGLMKIRTPAMKVISIISMAVSFLFLIWSFLPVTSPRHVSLNEVGPAFAIAGTIQLAFTIVAAVQAYRTEA